MNPGMAVLTTTANPNDGFLDSVAFSGPTTETLTIVRMQLPPV
jgi:hypothetical protein